MPQEKLTVATIEAMTDQSANRGRLEAASRFAEPDVRKAARSKLAQWRREAQEAHSGNDAA